MGKIVIISVLLTTGVFCANNGCVDADSAKVRVRDLLNDLGIEVEKVHCESAFWNVHSSCAARTVENQVYTIDCDWQRCVLLRGPGQ